MGETINHIMQGYVLVVLCFSLVGAGAHGIDYQRLGNGAKIGINQLEPRPFGSVAL